MNRTHEQLAAELGLTPEQFNDGLARIAWKQGKAVEYYSHKAKEWMYDPIPSWGSKTSLYRPKPEPAPVWTLGRAVNGHALAEGQEWHRDDFTEDDLKGGWRPLLVSEFDDELHQDIERKDGQGKWESLLGGDAWMAEKIEMKDCFFRTRRPLPAPTVWQLGNSVNGFTLGPGQQWHRTDGWTRDMLPEGTRPLLLGEIEQKQDEFTTPAANMTRWTKSPVSTKQGARAIDYHRRTTRPLPPVEQPQASEPEQRITSHGGYTFYAPLPDARGQL